VLGRVCFGCIGGRVCCWQAPWACWGVLQAAEWHVVLQTLGCAVVLYAVRWPLLSLQVEWAAAGALPAHVRPGAPQPVCNAHVSIATPPECLGGRVLTGPVRLHACTNCQQCIAFKALHFRTHMVGLWRQTRELNPARQRSPCPSNCQDNSMVRAACQQPAGPIGACSATQQHLMVTALVQRSPAVPQPRQAWHPSSQSAPGTHVPLSLRQADQHLVPSAGPCTHGIVMCSMPTTTTTCPPAVGTNQGIEPCQTKPGTSDCHLNSSMLMGLESQYRGRL